MKSFVKDTFSVGVSKFLIITFGLLTSIITARVLGPEKNGIIAALLVYPNIFISFGSLGIRQSTTYVVGQKIHNDEDVKTAIAQVWILATVVCLTSCYILMYTTIKENAKVLFILLALAPITFKLFNTYNSGFFLGKNNIRAFNRINWVPPFLVFAFSFVLLFIFNADVEGYLLALVMGPFITSILLFKRENLMSHFTIKLKTGIIKSLLKLGIVYAVALLVINLNYRFDVIMLQSMSSSYELGIYSKGSTVTEFLWQIPMLFSTIVFARSAGAKDGEAFSRKVAMLLRISFIMIIAASLVLWFLSQYIIIGMYGIEFADSTSVLNYLLPGVILLTIYKVMNMDLAGKGKPWVAIYAMAPALFLNIILNFFLIPKYGADGSAIASTISYSFAAVLFLIAYSRTVKVPLNEIVSYRKEDFTLFKDLLLTFKGKR